MRLHPVEDGLVPHPDERGMTRRDIGGNRLTDVTNPISGMCTGVTSPLTPSGASVRPASPIGGGSGADVRFDPESARYYELVRSSKSAPIGFVVRLTTDGDESLPCSRVVIIQAEQSPGGKSERVSNAPVRKAPSVREQNDMAAKAVLSAMGYTGPITPEIRNAALQMIEIEKNTVARLERAKRTTRPKGKKRATRANQANQANPS